MIFRNSLKSVLRTPVKTLLFLLLSAAVTAFACLGIGMRRSAERLLAEADDTFRTTAVLEYIGEGYPDPTAVDDEMAAALRGYDLSPLTSRPEVLSSDPQVSLGGSIPGLEVSASAARAYQDMAVVRFRVRYDQQGVLRCLIQDTLYSAPDYYAGIFFNLRVSDEMGAEMAAVGTSFRLGGVYLAYGRFTQGEKRTLVFEPQACLSAAAPDEPALRQLLRCPVVDLTEIEESDYAALPSYGQMEAVAETCQVLNNVLEVYAADQPDSFLEFQQQETSLSAGRFLTPEDRGRNVCMVSEYLCRQMGIGVGDEIDLDLFAQEGHSALQISFWAGNGYLRSGRYTVVGVFKDGVGLAYRLFVPKFEGLPERSVDYTVCRFRLDNAGAAEFAAAAEPLLLPAMQLTVFDQGYAEAAASLNGMLESAQVLLAVCAVAGLVIVLLVGYLFVARQRVEIRVMLALGAGRRRTVGYLLWGALAVVLGGSIPGAAAGYLMSGRVLAAAYTRALTERVGDSRFSNASVRGAQVDFTARLTADWGDPALACGLVLLLTLAVTGLLALYVTRGRTAGAPVRKRKKTAAVAGGGTPIAPPGTADAGPEAPLRVARGEALPTFSARRVLFPVRMALRAIVRGGGRTWAAGAASLCMALLIGAFSAGLSGYLAQRDAVYDTMPVSVYLTNYNGKQVDRLGIPDWLAEEISAAAGGADLCLTRGLYCMPIGLVRHADGSPAPDPGALELPTNSFALATFAESISGRDKLVFTNSLASAPAYFFEQGVPFEFLEGYDDASFAGAEPVCAVTREYLTENGFALGDTVRLSALGVSDYMAPEYGPLELKIVAVAPRLSGRETVYAALSAQEPVRFLMDRVVSAEGFDFTAYFRMMVMAGEERLPNHTSTSSYDSLSFRVEDTRSLTAFKDQLEKIGLSPVGVISGSLRSYAVVKDQQLYETVNGLSRHIAYMRALSAGVYALAVAMGFLTAYLLTRTRKPELALLRSTGAGVGTAFGTFFTELLLLCLAGTAAGLLLTAALYGGLTAEQGEGALMYVLCALVGSALAIGQMGRGHVLEILSRE